MNLLFSWWSFPPIALGHIYCDVTVCPHYPPACNPHLPNQLFRSERNPLDVEFALMSSENEFTMRLMKPQVLCPLWLYSVDTSLMHPCLCSLFMCTHACMHAHAVPCLLCCIVFPASICFYVCFHYFLHWNVLYMFQEEIYYKTPINTISLIRWRR